MEYAERTGVEAADRRMTDTRLDWLLLQNHRIARERQLYRNDRERLEAQAMRRPLKISKAYRYFGLMLGSVPPAALVARILADGNGPSADNFLFGALLGLAGILAGIAGYLSGRLTAKTVKRAEKFSLPNRAVMIAFVGMTWGIACGAAGGVVIFLIGAIPGAFIGGVTAAAALPIFATMVSLLRRGDSIALGHFMPISLGIVFAIAAFILGI
jgi:hypothetical protein